MAECIERINLDVLASTLLKQPGNCFFRGSPEVVSDLMVHGM
eukprot:gene4454-20697_t